MFKSTFNEAKYWNVAQFIKTNKQTQKIRSDIVTKHETGEGLTDDGRVVGLLPETELPQLFHQIFVHFAHHQ